MRGSSPGLPALALLGAMAGVATGGGAAAQTGYDGPGIIRPLGPPQPGQGYDARGAASAYSQQQQILRQQGYDAARPAPAAPQSGPLSEPPRAMDPLRTEDPTRGSDRSDDPGTVVDPSTQNLFLPRKPPYPLD